MQQKDTIVLPEETKTKSKNTRRSFTHLSLKDKEKMVHDTIKQLDKDGKSVSIISVGKVSGITNSRILRGPVKEYKDKKKKK